MTPYYDQDGITIYVGDNRDVLPHLENISAVVTDPPYGLSFMGKDWDHSVPGEAFWRIIADAMKPGAHLLSFGGTRTFHRIAVAIEDAGLELRDTLMWLYGSGFPKSHDVSKAIDKAAGAEREVVGTRDVGPDMRGDNYGRNDGERMLADITAPATPEAEAWQGWGTALKPSFEPVILARKPLIGTVAANVLAHGTGALNIDASRIGATDNTSRPPGKPEAEGWGLHKRTEPSQSHTAGRWPANVILDEDAAEGHEWSRYFYCAKASRRERNAGLDGMPEVSPFERGGPSANFERMGSKSTARQNHHPTVKPLALMRYLVTLITPPGGIVLDPFAGSGSTLVACAELGIPAIGIEMNEEYAEIAARRVCHAKQQTKQAVLA